MESISLKEAKLMIDQLVVNDISSVSESEKRAKVLNKILHFYTITPSNGSYNIDQMYSLEDIGYLLGTSKQYVRAVENKVKEKLSKALNDYV